MRCEHAFDDGAYVLGALSPAERDRFETHLATCARCREAVAGLAVLPGLLGRLSPADVPTALTSQLSEQRLPRLIHTATVTRRSRRRRAVAVAVLSTCVAAFAGLTLGSARTTVTPPPITPTTSIAPTASAQPMHAMRPLEGVPVTAEISYADATEGTKVRMKCWYPPDPEHTRRYSFYLIALGHDGEREPVSSWMAGAGEDVTITGTVRLPIDDILRFEVQRKDGTPLLVYEIP